MKYIEDYLFCPRALQDSLIPNRLSIIVPAGSIQFILATCFIMGNTTSSENSATVLSLLSGLPKIPCASKPSLFTIISQFSLLTRHLSNSNSHYVAVKIKTAEASAENSEQYILSYISQQGNSVPMSRHVITLLDTFEHQGPNGKYFCIVFALSQSVSNLLLFTPEYFHVPVTIFPYSRAKRVLKQTFMGICFLHSHGVIHGDIHQGNILFADPDLESYTMEKLEQDETLGVL